MRKTTVDCVRNYIRNLSDVDLGWLCSRLSDRLGGDVAEAVNFMSKNQHMDRLLYTASTANELYDIVDVVQQYAEQDNRLSFTSN